MFRLKTVPLLTFLLIASCGSQPERANFSVHKAKGPKDFSPLSAGEKAYYESAIEPLYENLLLKRGFNGSILLAKNGEVVFEDYHGLANFKTKEPITSNTQFHIASVSKTFTSAAVLKLMEDGKIALDDKVEKFFPEFPYRNITIRNLLSHRSGLPKYDHFLDGTVSEVILVKNRRGKLVKRTRIFKKPLPFTGPATNEDLLQYMIKFRPPIEALPDRRYSYCNTNFALLALIVEKITHMPFPEYMKKNLFEPLGMNHTFIFSIADTANYQPSYNYNRAPFKLDILDCIYGDKNVYSTVRDLFLWDKALYMDKYVSAKSQELAYKPYSFERRGDKNYGLGWHLLIKPPDPTIVYHNGWWHGNNAVFKRLVADTATVIILGNKFNRNIWSAGKMSSVFTGHADTTRLEGSDE